MLVKTRSEVPNVEWGNGTSSRLLVEADKMGFAVAHTVVRAGSQSPLQYRNHLEACYCIRGRGQVVADGVAHDIEPGVIYALNQHDEHLLVADEGSDMELISVFNPPLRGDERHNLDADGYSEY